MNGLLDQVWMKVMKPLTQNAKVIANKRREKTASAFINLSTNMYELIKFLKLINRLR
jgi:hypothetical protein